MTNEWPGLAREQVDEIANRYETACLIALRRAHLGGALPEVADRNFNEMRTGIVQALCRELRDLGCPESLVDKTAFEVISRAVRARVLAAVPTAGSC